MYVVTAIGMLSDAQVRTRTPKQKMKFKVTSESLLNKLKKWASWLLSTCSVITDPRKEVKIKEASQMNQIVSIVTDQIHEMQTVPQATDTELGDEEEEEKKNANSVLKTKLLQLVAVMQQGGQFKGFNRKFQLRALQWREEKEEEVEEEEEKRKEAEASQLAERESVQSTLPPVDDHFELRHGVEKVQVGVEREE